MSADPAFVLIKTRDYNPDSQNPPEGEVYWGKEIF